MIWFACKKCGKTQGRPESLAGTLVFCDCSFGIRVPWSEHRRRAGTGSRADSHPPSPFPPGARSGTFWPTALLPRARRKNRRRTIVPGARANPRAPNPRLLSQPRGRRLGTYLRRLQGGVLRRLCRDLAGPNTVRTVQELPRARPEPAGARLRFGDRLAGGRTGRRPGHVLPEPVQLRQSADAALDGRGHRPDPQRGAIVPLGSLVLGWLSACAEMDAKPNTGGRSLAPDQRRQRPGRRPVDTRRSVGCSCSNKCKDDSRSEKRH